MNKCLGFYDTQKWRLIESWEYYYTTNNSNKTKKNPFDDWTRTNEWNEKQLRLFEVRCIFKTTVRVFRGLDLAYFRVNRTNKIKAD